MNIEQLAINAYMAEQERKHAKAMRAIMLRNNPCAAECEDRQPCFRQYLGNVGKYLPFDQWCDNCKKVQPFHIEYRKKAVIANHAKGRLTITIKKQVAKAMQIMIAKGMIKHA